MTVCSLYNYLLEWKICTLFFLILLCLCIICFLILKITSFLKLFMPIHAIVIFFILLIIASIFFYYDVRTQYFMSKYIFDLFNFDAEFRRESLRQFKKIYLE